MRALVVGCGYMGRIHSSNLKRLGVEVLQFDIVKGKCDSYVDQLYGHEVDVIVIATPIRTHYEIFSKLYESYGKGVVYFIEKPVVGTSDQLRRIKGILSEGAEVFVGHQLRYSKFYELIKEEAKGNPYFEVDMEVNSPSDPEAGLILDTGIHFIDLPIYYLGRPRDFRVSGSKNFFDLLLYYERGVWRVMGALRDYYRVEFRVNGKRGVNDGVSMKFCGEVFKDVDPYYEEMRDVVGYARDRRSKPRISLEKLLETYELAFSLVELLTVT